MISGAPPGLGRYAVALLNSLGFRAQVRVGGVSSDYFNRVADPRTRAQMGFGAWALDYPSASDFIRPLLSCAAYVPSSPETTTNLAGFCDRKVDAMMARAAETAVHEPAAAITLWQRVEDELLAEAPVIPAYNRTFISFVSDRLGNYQYHPQWGVLLSQLWVR
jgi:peptide/nickel transport system substrate-binding protein